MKRLLSIFSLAAMLLLGLAHPQAVQAAVTCTAYNSGTTWPYGHVFSCSNTTAQNANYVWGAVSQAGADTLSNIQKNDPLFFWLFNTPADYSTYCSAHTSSFPGGCVTPSNSASGFTARNGTSGKTYYTVVLQKNGDGVTNNYIQNTAAHEEGHTVDYIYRALPGSGLIRLSDSTLFQHEINADWTPFNKQDPCEEVPGQAGQFTNQVDSNGAYICSGTDGYGEDLSLDYSGDSNEQVLQAAWSAIYDANNEIFAEAWAVQLGFTDSQIDYYWQQGSVNFTCTKLLTSQLYSSGALPTSAQWKAKGCPTS